MGYWVEGNRIFTDEEWRDVCAARAADAAADTRLALKIFRALIHYCLLSAIVYVQVLHMHFLNESELINSIFTRDNVVNTYGIVIIVISFVHLFVKNWITRVINIVFAVYIYFVIYPILQSYGFVSVFA